MRFLAIDLGDKRTGLAVGDDETGLATPVELIERGLFVKLREEGAGSKRRDRDFNPELIGAIERAIHEHLGPGEGVVVGLALHMDGTEGPRAALSRRFAEVIGGRTGRVVHLQDERRSSVSADQRLARTGLTHGEKRQRRDAIAAAEVLQRFLDARRAGAGGPRPGAGG